MTTQPEDRSAAWRALARSRRARLAALLAGCAVLVALAWLLLHGANDESLERVLESGTLRVAIEGDNPPFGLLADDQMSGLDVDLARALADALGVEVQFTVMGYDSLYDALDVWLVDAVISALRVDPDRTGDVRYTRPYLNAGQVMVVPKGAALRSAADLEGRTVAVEFGSEGDVWARREQRRRAALDVVRYDAPVAALDALVDGAADAAVVDAISVWVYPNAGALEVVEYVTDEPYAVAVRIEGEALWRVLDAALVDMIEDGRLERIIARWF
ncbi:MAG: ABC transporter substrate-binding protein [Anaerolineae bacterium]|nr:ABC transporter substrate-binding protein [Anaerolineae bacterium]